MNKKIALISGATSGIGEATARKLASAGINLILTGRRKSRLEDLCHLLERACNIQTLPLTFDVRKQETVSEAIENLPDAWKSIDILINNAGLAAGLSSIDEGDLNDWETMIDTNVKGLLYLSREVIPLMKKSGGGHIVNIGSIAGKEVYPRGNVYCATKHAVDALSKAMRIDLLPYNIKVTCINPGAVNTEFSLVRFKGDQEKADSVYKGFVPLSGDDIAGIIHFVVNLPWHVNINDLVVMPTAQASASLINRKN